MEWVITIITIAAAVVTIIWFVRDIRRENSKILKAILDTQNPLLEIQRASLEVHKTSLEIQKASLQILKEHGEILARIEEGQRKGFETLSQILDNQSKILERIYDKI